MCDDYYSRLLSKLHASTDDTWNDPSDSNNSVDLDKVIPIVFDNARSHTVSVSVKEYSDMPGLRRFPRELTRIPRKKQRSIEHPCIPLHQDQFPKLYQTNSLFLANQMNIALSCLALLPANVLEISPAKSVECKVDQRTCAVQRFDPNICFSRLDVAPRKPMRTISIP
jgi:hypothetical protein